MLDRRRIRTISVSFSALLLGGTGCFLARPVPAVVPAPPEALDAESVEFPSESGSRIHAWLSRGRPGTGAVLLLHGVGANRTSMVSRARFLHAQGFSVVAIDFQGHGESPGPHVTFGVRESDDARAALAFLRAALPGERVGVIGVSMGGAASLLGPAPLDVDAYVLESVYPTIRDAVRGRLGTWFGPLSAVGRGLAPAVIRAVSSEIGVRESELQPIARIGRIQAPLLLMSGSADRYTPRAEAESLYARAPSPKSLWVVEGAGHEDLHEYRPAEYESRVGAFLIANLRRPGG